MSSLGILALLASVNAASAQTPASDESNLIATCRSPLWGTTYTLTFNRTSDWNGFALQKVIPKGVFNNEPIVFNYGARLIFSSGDKITFADETYATSLQLDPAKNSGVGNFGGDKTHLKCEIDQEQLKKILNFEVSKRSPALCLVGKKAQAIYVAHFPEWVSAGAYETHVMFPELSPTNSFHRNCEYGYLMVRTVDELKELRAKFGDQIDGLPLAYWLNGHRTNP